MTTGYDPEYASAASPPRDESIGNLVSQVAGDVSTLFRQEVALAKEELKAEAMKAGKAGGMLAGAGFAGYMVAVLLRLALVFALDAVMPLGWAAVIVAVIWAIIGGVLTNAARYSPPNARAAVAADVTPDISTANATRNVTNGRFHARCAYSAAPAARGYLPTSSA